MLAELVDAVVGIDTHRDTHQVEIALPTGAPIATCSITNDTRGYAELLAWIAEHTPGPRLAVSIEGTRSYGVGVTRALGAAGLAVIEAEQPARKTRRGRGKSDPIDAHLAVQFALRLDVDRLPTPRADGDRDALRILLGARHDLTMASTAQTNRLRALLRDGDGDGGDTDGELARGALPEATLTTLARRRLPCDATRAQAVRHGEIRRLALAVRDGRPSAQGQPGPATGHRRRAGPRADRPPWHRPGQRRPGHRQLLPPRPLPRTTPRSPPWPGPAPWRPAAGAPYATGSTAAATARSTAPCTPSP